MNKNDRILDFQQLWKKRPEFLRGMANLEQLNLWFKENPLPNSPQLVFIGRSNVGKSSLLNALFGNKLARVSNTPGRTQQVNLFSGNILSSKDDAFNFYLYDLPGHGHAKVSKEMQLVWDQLMGLFFSKIHPLSLCLLLQDARHPSTENDQAMYDFLRSQNLPTFLIFTKYDKLKTQSERHQFEKIKKEILNKYKNVQQIHIVSNVTYFGVDVLAKGIHNYLASFMPKQIP